MKTGDFNKVVEEQLKRCTDVLIVKAREYATNDRLHNFKVAANLQSCTFAQALAGMMAKHTVSIYDMCGSMEEFPIEQWNEKITDHINYLLLLRAMVEESIRDRNACGKSPEYMTLHCDGSAELLTVKKE